MSNSAGSSSARAAHILPAQILPAQILPARLRPAGQGKSPRTKSPRTKSPRTKSPGQDRARIGFRHWLIWIAALALAGVGIGIAPLSATPSSHAPDFFVNPLRVKAFSAGPHFASRQAKPPAQAESTAHLRCVDTDIAITIRTRKGEAQAIAVRIGEQAPTDILGALKSRLGADQLPAGGGVFLRAFACRAKTLWSAEFYFRGGANDKRASSAAGNSGLAALRSVVDFVNGAPADAKLYFEDATGRVKEDPTRVNIILRRPDDGSPAILPSKVIFFDDRANVTFIHGPVSDAAFVSGDTQAQFRCRGADGDIRIPLTRGTAQAVEIAFAGSPGRDLLPEILAGLDGETLPGGGGAFTGATECLGGAAWRVELHFRPVAADLPVYPNLYRTGTTHMRVVLDMVGSKPVNAVYSLEN